jgi:hypothetical protein
MTAIDYLVEQLQKEYKWFPSTQSELILEAKEMERNQLIDFFKFFRDNGENHIGLTIEQFVDLYLKSNVTPESL